MSSTATRVRRIYLIRHGEAEARNVLLGQFDSPLSAEGRGHAERLAQQLLGRGIERVVSSTLKRAVETAEVLSRTLQVELEKDARLNEITYGVWDGLPWEEIEQADPGTARSKLEDWWDVTPLGGEPFPVFCQRVERAWHALVEHPARISAVVAHRAVNAVLLELSRQAPPLLGEDGALDRKRVLTFEQDYGTFAEVQLPASR